MNLFENFFGQQRVNGRIKKSNNNVKITPGKYLYYFILFGLLGISSRFFLVNPVHSERNCCYL